MIKKCSCGKEFDSNDLPNIIGEDEFGIYFNCPDCESTCLVPKEGE